MSIGHWSGEEKHARARPRACSISRSSAIINRISLWTAHIWCFANSCRFPTATDATLQCSTTTTVSLAALLRQHPQRVASLVHLRRRRLPLVAFSAAQRQHRLLDPLLPLQPPVSSAQFSLLMTAVGLLGLLAGR